MSVRRSARTKTVSRADLLEKVAHSEGSSTRRRLVSTQEPKFLQPVSGRRLKKKITPTRRIANIKNSGEWLDETLPSTALLKLDYSKESVEEAPQKEHVALSGSEASSTQQKDGNVTNEPSETEVEKKPPERELTFELEPSKFDHTESVGNTFYACDPSISKDLKSEIPEKRLTFELETSVTGVEILKRDSESFSPIVKKKADRKMPNNILRGVKKNRNSDDTRNLRRKLGILMNNSIKTTASMDKTLRDKVKEKEDSVIVISSTENTPEQKQPQNTKKPIVGLLKDTLIKEYNTKIKESKNDIKHRTKMPNFAHLHQKQYDQMEDIVTMMKRKQERAKVLLSGNKPQTIIKISTPISKKNLFSPINKLPLNTENGYSDNSTPKKKINFANPLEQSPKRHFPKTPKPPKFPEEPEMKTQRERRKTREGYTRYGFKKILPVAKENRAVEIHAVANKTRATAAPEKEKRRETLKGVRLNRRFELLMAMRKG